MLIVVGSNGAGSIVLGNIGAGSIDVESTVLGNKILENIDVESTDEENKTDVESNQRESIDENLLTLVILLTILRFQDFPICHVALILIPSDKITSKKFWHYIV